MNVEDGFLQDIQAHPDDSALRLVYADWFEERGDVRGEFIRIQEEMNTLPVYSDRHAELKIRRNELREQIDAGWREKLGYPRHRPMFTHLPERRIERWRLVEEFIDTWHKPLKPGDGASEEELRATEESLGFRLPTALREWYALAGKREDIWTIDEGALHELSQLRADATQFNIHEEAIIFFSMGNGQEAWGIRWQDLGREDPPVFAFYQPGQVSATVTEFAIMALVTNFIYQPILKWAYFPPNDPAFHEIASKFQKCAVPSFCHPGGPVPVYEGVDIFVQTGADIIVDMNGNSSLFVAARTEAAYQQLSEELRRQLEPHHSPLSFPIDVRPW
jgi:uncharacterized protein (TIGR02996 family)